MVAIGWTGGAVTGEVGTAVVAVSCMGSGTGDTVGVGCTGSAGFGVAPSLDGSVIARVSFGA
jgi:hypothetical protein